MTKCPGLYPHTVDPAHCTICMASDIDLDFLFSDVVEISGMKDEKLNGAFTITESAITSFSADMHRKAVLCQERIGELTKPAWHKRLKHAIKQRLQWWITDLECWLAEW